MLTVDSYVSKSDQVPWRMIEDEAILVDVERGNVIQLNEVGAFIWDRIDGKKPVGKIVDSVLQSFEVDRRRAEKDTFEFLGQLFEKQIIKLK